MPSKPANHAIPQRSLFQNPPKPLQEHITLHLQNAFLAGPSCSIVLCMAWQHVSNHVPSLQATALSVAG